MLEIVFSLLIIQIPLTDHHPHESDFRIISTGSFHGNEIKARDGETWFGLYEFGSGCFLQPTELLIESVHDPLLDRDDAMTGRMVSAVGQEVEPLFLLRPINGVFQEGPIPTVLVNSPVLLPDTTITLGDYGYLFTTDKGLFLSDGETIQRLSSVYPESHGEQVSVVWAGDLDADGLVDVIVDDQAHYAYVMNLILFLSSEADPGSLVKEVATFSAVSC